MKQNMRYLASNLCTDIGLLLGEYVAARAHCLGEGALFDERRSHGFGLCHQHEWAR